MLGGIEERLQQADGIQDLERAGLDRGSPRLAVRPNLPLDESRFHTVARELGGGEQPGRPSADDQDILSRHSIPEKHSPGSASSSSGLRQSLYGLPFVTPSNAVWLSGTRLPPLPRRRRR